MAYLQNYQNDIFISYSHVDNQETIGHGRWVNMFHESLEKGLAQQLGRNQIQIWRDKRLSDHDLINPSITEACKNSALLISITSPGYMKSTWCQKEYRDFCGANGDERPPRHGNESRILNVRLMPVREKQESEYNRCFGKFLGKKFFNESSNFPIYPPRPEIPELEYLLRVRALARDIVDLLDSMKEAMDPAPDLPARSNKKGNKSHPRASASIHNILMQPKKRLIISAHTLDRFTQDNKTWKLINALLDRDVEVTLIALNPHSKYAQAHSPYHELESQESSDNQLKLSLKFIASFFTSLTDDMKSRLTVVLSNYMPRFRTILVDDACAYVYLYMYGHDVEDFPDFTFRKNGNKSASHNEGFHKLFERTSTSIYHLKTAPEAIPFISNGKLYDYWDRSNLAQWDSWDSDIRYKHRITHQYYVTYAEEFDTRFGSSLEHYVKQHLNLLNGRTIVLGCGSGKEVEYLANQGKCHELYGVDFSVQAINLAVQNKKTAYPDREAEFIVADFYDFEHLLEGEFDSVVANATFVHLLRRDDMADILKCIWDKLRPGGKCFIRNLYKEEDGEPKVQEFDHSTDAFGERWFVYYSRNDLTRLATEAGFRIDEEMTLEIAKDCEAGKPFTVKEKGFPHANHDEVYWSTVLLEKMK